MIEQDTVKLLRECDAGVKMGISAIDDVQDKVKNDGFSALLRDSRAEHIKINDEIKTLLDRYHDDGKEPSGMAKTMSKLRTDMKMAFDNSDQAIADLMTDGCNMGVKSLHRYRNQYKAADEQSKDITKRLVNIEERLAVDMRNYL